MSCSQYFNLESRIVDRRMQGVKEYDSIEEGTFGTV